MLTNDDFRLSAGQLKKYNDWAQERATAAAKSDVLESHAITVSFTFSPFGREVVAAVESSTARIVLEE